jgi:hypothetical protein
MSHVGQHSLQEPTSDNSETEETSLLLEQLEETSLLLEQLEEAEFEEAVRNGTVAAASADFAPMVPIRMPSEASW